MLREGFQALVLQDAMLDMLGPAINSAKSLFLYGAPGNGKTFISEAIAGLLGGSIFIPYSVDVEGQILSLYDPIYHETIPDDPGIPEEGWLQPPHGYDRRFVRIRRPVVMVGGELTLDQLDLKYDPFAKTYSAPFQMKANGGVLILDDFGRQRIPPRDLLNRWIVPLEKRIDFLTLHTGGKFPVPFDTLLIFATNLAPTDLVEEAFLRRIHYKINVLGPDPNDYREIFRRCCEERGLIYNEAAVRYVYDEWYGKRGIEPRACHPRDLLDHVLDISHFREVEPHLSRELMERSCRSYFLDDIRAAK
jgi:predicted ATPase with chaperone activity